MPPKIRHESEVNRVISVMGGEVSSFLRKIFFLKMFSSYTSQNTINLTNLLNFERDRQDKKDYETESIWNDSKIGVKIGSQINVFA